VIINLWHQRMLGISGHNACLTSQSIFYYSRLRLLINLLRFYDVGCHITCKGVLEHSVLILETEASLCFQEYKLA
jgi:hypothetical protein